jgi:hypothetical protein
MFMAFEPEQTAAQTVGNKFALAGIEPVTRGGVRLAMGGRCGARPIGRRHG